MTASVHCLDALQLRQLRQDVFEQAGLVHEFEGHGRMGAEQHLVQFFRDALFRENRHPVAHPVHGVEGFRNYLKFMVLCAEFGCESDCAEHSQRVVAVGRVRVERGADNSCRQIANAAERVHQRPEIFFLQAQCQCVDGEVASFLVVFQCAVFYYRFSGIAVIRFFSRAHEFDFCPVVFQHGCAEILEYRDAASVVFAFTYMVSYGSGQFDSAAFDYDVYVICLSA